MALESKRSNQTVAIIDDGRTCVEVDGKVFGIVAGHDRVDKLAIVGTCGLQTEHGRQRFGSLRYGGKVVLRHENGHRLVDDFDADNGL